jgi:hypothetical protein
VRVNHYFLLALVSVFMTPIKSGAQTNRPAFQDPKLQSAVIQMEAGLKRFNKENATVASLTNLGHSPGRHFTRQKRTVIR